MVAADGWAVSWCNEWPSSMITNRNTAFGCAHTSGVGIQSALACLVIEAGAESRPSADVLSAACVSGPTLKTRTSMMPRFAAK